MTDSATQIRVRACVAVVEDSRILLVPHYDTDAGPVQWVIPGGQVRAGESLATAAIREFREETGLQAEIGDLLDVSEVLEQNPPYHSITATYRGTVTGGSMAAEAGHAYGRKVPAWFSVSDLDAIAYHPPRAVENALRVGEAARPCHRPFDPISDFIFVEHEIERADIILVPGGSAPELMGRAAELFARGFASHILPSGGPSTWLPDCDSEWAFLRTIGVAAGIPGQAILKEDRATNTLENARYSWDVIEREGLAVSRAILVCKAHHSRRALLTYQAVFPLGCQFFVSPIVDFRGITKENWFLDPEKTSLAFEEVRKIGTFLGGFVSRWATQET